MMKTRFVLGLSLIILLLAACAPGSSATNPPNAGTNLPAEALPTPTLAALTLEPGTQVAPSEAATVVPLATSRGPNLEATDPATVSLASGGVQFVEFFRFT